MNSKNHEHQWRHIPREGGGETLYRVYETGNLKTALEKMDKTKELLEQYAPDEDIMLTLSNTYFTISVDLSVSKRTHDERKVFTDKIDKVLD